MDDAARILQLIVNGAASGCIYGLIALGFVLIFKASGVFNFAQGAMVLFGALAMARFAEWIPAWTGIDNKILANLQTESDTVLTPLAARRDKVQGFINNANKTAEATAERSDAIQANFERLPSYLRELRPTLADLSNLADAHVALGDYAAARPLYEQALAIRKAVFGEDHPDAFGGRISGPRDRGTTAVRPQVHRPATARPAR